MSEGPYDDLVDFGEGRPDRPRRSPRGSRKEPAQAAAGPVAAPTQTRGGRGGRTGGSGRGRGAPGEPVEARQGIVDGTSSAGPVEDAADGSHEKEVEDRGPLLTPAGENYRAWLERSLTADRQTKSYSAPAISNAHARILRQDQMLLEDLGYSRREISVGNMLELAVELQHQYLQRLVSEGPGY